MKAIRKDFYVQIKKTYSRFISLFLIVALGVAFYAGIRSTEPDMRTSADQVYDDCNMMDIRVLSNLGITDKDITSVKHVSDIESAEGIYNLDLVVKHKNEEVTARMISLSEDINVPHMVKGKLPKNQNQCIIDSQFADNKKVQIGDIVEINDDEIKGNSYTVTGVFTLGNYLSVSKGTTTVGTGTINGLIIIDKSQFDLNYYTDMYVTVKSAKAMQSYSDKYKDTIDKAVSNINKTVAKHQAKLRYEEVYKDAEKKINDAENTLKEKTSDYENGVKKITTAKNDIRKQNKKLASAQKEIDKNENKLKNAKTEYDSGYRKYIDGKNNYNNSVKEYKAGYKKYNQGLKNYNSGLKTYKDAKVKLEKSEELYNASMQEYQANYARYEQAVQAMGTILTADLKEELDEGKAKLDAVKIQIASGKEQLVKSKNKLDKARSKLNKTSEKLKEAKSKLDSGSKELTETSKKLAEAKATISEGYIELNKAKEKVTAGKGKLTEAKKKITKSEKRLEKAKSKLDKAQRKIDKNRTKLNDIESGKWYVLDREYIQTYEEFNQDATRIGNIGTVFPIIFFLVAAMVSLTTMTRMVEEERTQIGTLKALGYGKFQIAAKYLAYGALATITGGIVGGIIGSKTIPYIIIRAYRMLYRNLYVTLTPLNKFYFVTAMLVAFISVVGATILSCYGELRTQPAELMRQEAPKVGKRVLLERVPAIWRHISFNLKSTLRNLFRYKKRLFMTLFGISGCMALLLVGFGMKNSINSILTIQFNELFHYDAVVNYDEDYVEKNGSEKVKALYDSSEIREYIEVNETSKDVGHGSKTLSTYIVVPNTTKDISNFITLRSRTKNEEYKLKENSAIISEKLATELGVKVGDAVYIKESDTKKHDIKVSAIVENYCYNYLYMTKGTYEKLYGTDMQINSVFLKLKDGRVIDKETAKTMMENKTVSNVSFIADIYKKFEETMTSLDAIVYILVISAGALAFIVLYNLNNINISERRRELATLKVLGLYDNEVSGYIYRENIIITIIGILLGTIFGYFLHQYVMQTAEISMVMFGRKIGVLGYIYSTLITISFAALINLSMHYKLKKVDMATSLKSGE